MGARQVQLQNAAIYGCRTPLRRVAGGHEQGCAGSGRGRIGGNHAGRMDRRAIEPSRRSPCGAKRSDRPAAPSSKTGTALGFWRRDGRESSAASPDCEHNPKLSLSARLQDGTVKSNRRGPGNDITGCSSITASQRPCARGARSPPSPTFSKAYRRAGCGRRLAHQDLEAALPRLDPRPVLANDHDRVMIGAMGFIYAKLFHTPMEGYLPLLAAGLVFWQFASGMITEGCSTFFSQQGIIQQVRLPFSLHAYRLVYRNLLILAHNFVIIPSRPVIFPQPIAWPRLLELGPGWHCCC